MYNADQLKSLFPAAADIPAQHRIAKLVHQRHSLVDGEMVPWQGETTPVYSPVRLQDGDGSLSPVLLGSFPATGEEQARQALAAAVRAYDYGRGLWPTMTVAERIAAVGDFTKRMIARKDDVVRMMMWEIGKSFADCQKEFDRTVDYIRATIDALKAHDNDNSRFITVDGVIGQVRRAPLGVVLCMGPYNYPLNETFTTLIPAMIMGNTIVFKPPRIGVLLFEPLLEAFRDAFPKGVVNTVYGKGEILVPEIMKSGEVNALALIGSSKVADALVKLHPKTNRLRAVLGLDAKNPAIVLEDADLELAAKECAMGALSFNGQRCTALKMLLVHARVVEPFLDLFKREVGKLKLGMPWQEGVAITPLPEPGKSRYMQELIEDACKKGAKIVNEGGGVFAETLFQPAILYPVDAGMRVYREEQFGPVTPVMPFNDLQTALDYVIHSDYGQQVSIFSNDPDMVGRLIDPLANQVCRVNVNCQCQRGPDIFPFTGRKDSAQSTLSVSDALRAFSIRSMVAAKQTDANKELLSAIAYNHKSKFVTTDFIL